MKLLRPGYLWLAAIIVVVPCLVWQTIQYPIRKKPEPAEFSPPRSQAEANRQDLSYLRDTLKRIDRSFSPAAWVAFDATIDELMGQAGALTAAEFELGVAHALAAADNGHTNIRGVGWGLTLNALPLRFGWFAEGLFIIAADPANQDLIGARVLAENGRTPEELAEAFKGYVGGPATLARELTPHFMKSPAALHAAGLSPSSSLAQMDLQLRDGTRTTRTVTALPSPANGPRPATITGRDPRERWPRRDLTPLESPNSVHEWVHALHDRKQLPVSLQHLDRFYWRTPLADHDALYIQINAVANQPGDVSLEVFLQQSVEYIEAHRPRTTLIDLRSNSGGNYALTAAFTEALPAKLPAGGHIFILTSGNTFSAAIITAARLKYYARGNATILGAPMGDRERFWAEASARITLPNSKLVATYSTGYHDWQHGCSLRELFICAPENLYLGVAAGSLAPATEIDWSFEDYVNGRDTVMEGALRGSGEARETIFSENR